MRDLPNPGVKPMSPALASRFFATEPPGKPANEWGFEGGVWEEIPTPGMGAGVKAALSYQWLLYPISGRGSFWSVMKSSSWKLHRAPTDSQVWPQVVKSILERARLFRLCLLCGGQGSHLAVPQASPIRVKKEDLGLLPAHLLQVGRPPQSFLRDLPHFRYPVHDLPLRGPGRCTQEGGASHLFIELAPPGMVFGL